MTEPSTSFLPQSTKPTSTTQKLKSKQAAQNMRFGSPKLRDLLRQKCRIRIKECRTQSFDCKRNIFRNKDLVNLTIKEELQNLNFDIEQQEIILREILENADEWNFDAIQEEVNELGEFADSQFEPFFCPACMKGYMVAGFGFHMCQKCNIKLRSNISIDEYQYKIQRKLVEHETTNCSENLAFFTEPSAGSTTNCSSSSSSSSSSSTATEISNLNLFCTNCDFYATL